MSAILGLIVGTIIFFLINKSFDFVNTYFPQYKKNMYFSGKTGLYIKCINKVNADVTARILGKIMKG